MNSNFGLLAAKSVVCEKIHQTFLLGSYVWILLGVWTLMVCASIAWNLLQQQQEAIMIARHVAVTIYDRDVLYRRWASVHGGVYVPVSAQSPPTPYLANIPERDLTTPSGRTLTLLNPAYMTRQVYKYAQGSGQVKGHITSLKPIRAENAPDTWEREALKTFETGMTERSSLGDIDGILYMRLMRPFITEQSCLGCHAKQGYKVGDIRGGISVAVPMAPILAEHSRSPLVLGHFGLWFLGIAGIIVSARRLNQNTAEKIKAQEAAAAATMAVRTIEGMMDSVVLTDREGMITHINRAFADTFGWGGEVRGELPTKLVVKSDIPKVMSSIQECLAKGHKKDLEAVFLTKDRKEVPVSINLSHLKNPHGDLTGVIALIRDIRELRQAQEALKGERQRLFSLLENLPAAIYLVRPDYSLVFVNRFFRELFGEPDDRPCYEVLHGRSGSCEDCPALRVFERKSPKAHEWTRPDGSIYQLYHYPFDDVDSSPLVLVMGIDITELKQAEAEIRNLNEGLELRVQERTAQLEAANKELESFAYSVSHDLRAPLRAIDGFSRILSEECGGQLDEEAKGYLDRIMASSRRMGLLIDDILKLSRLSRTEMAMREVNISALVREITAELQAAEPDRQVEFSIEDGLLVFGSQRLLRIALENLLGNAWKFTSRKPQAQVAFGSIEQGGERCFFVRDNGSGFNMAYGDKIFKPFERLHKNSEFPGTGIGLAIVYRIFQRHGGHIWAESTEGQGSTFYFSLKENGS